MFSETTKIPTSDTVLYKLLDDSTGIVTELLIPYAVTKPPNQALQNSKAYRAAYCVPIEYDFNEKTAETIGAGKSMPFIVKISPPGTRAHERYQEVPLIPGYVPPDSRSRKEPIFSPRAIILTTGYSPYFSFYPVDNVRIRVSNIV